MDRGRGLGLATHDAPMPKKFQFAQTQPPSIEDVDDRLDEYYDRISSNVQTNIADDKDHNIHFNIATGSSSAAKVMRISAKAKTPLTTGNSVKSHNNRSQVLEPERIQEIQNQLQQLQ